MDALAALRLQIEWGADEALAENPLDRRIAAAAPRPARSTPPPAPPPGPPPGPTPIGLAARAQDLADAADTVEALQAALAGFEGCALRATATQPVLADGNSQAGLVVIGEAPGTEEDRAGKPLVGPSGRYFDRMLGSIGLTRNELLIVDLVPWRPPGERPPTESELALCLPFLLRHLALIRPRHLVLLGGVVTKAVTGRPASIRRLRGRWIDVAIPGLPGPVPALPMLPPDHVRRNPAARQDSWSDLLTLRQALSSDADAR